MNRRRVWNLPQEEVGPASARAIWQALAGTALVVLLMNVSAIGVLWFGDPVTNNGDTLMRAKWKMILEMTQPVDWVILGDSTALQGVVPDVIGRSLGGTAVNLATLSPSTALGDAWTLATYIRRFGPPQGVIVVHNYRTWHIDELDYRAIRVPLAWAQLNRLQPEIKLSTREYIPVYISQVFPLYWDSPRLSWLFQFPWSKFTVRSSVQEDGFMPSRTKPHPQAAELQALKEVERIRDDGLRLSQLNRLAVERIGALADQYAFDVYIVEGPLFQGLYQNEHFLRSFRELQAMLVALTARSDRVHYVSQVPITFAEDEMQDAYHPLDATARVYTEEVSKQIAAIRPQPRG